MGVLLLIGRIYKSNMTDPVTGLRRFLLVRRQFCLRSSEKYGSIWCSRLIP